MDKPTPKPIEPPSRLNPLKLTIAFLPLMVLVGFFVYYFNVINRPIVTYKPEGISESFSGLQPGSHFVDKYPFLIEIERNEFGLLTEKRWSYEVRTIPYIKIPSGFKGIITDKGSVLKDKSLPPGIYRLDPDLYNIEIKEE